MKKRLAKKIEKMRRKKIHEALEITLQINSTQERQREATGYKPTTFFSFLGHVAKVDVRVFSSGWHSGYGPDACFEAEGYSNSNVSLDGMIAELKSKTKGLR